MKRSALNNIEKMEIVVIGAEMPNADNDAEENEDNGREDIGDLDPLQWDEAGQDGPVVNADNNAEMNDANGGDAVANTLPFGDNALGLHLATANAGPIDHAANANKQVQLQLNGGILDLQTEADAIANLNALPVANANNDIEMYDENDRNDGTNENALLVDIAARKNSLKPDKNGTKEDKSIAANVPLQSGIVAQQMQPAIEDIGPQEDEIVFYLGPGGSLPKPMTLRVNDKGWFKQEDDVFSGDIAYHETVSNEK